MNISTPSSTKRIRWPRYSLRRFLAGSVLLGVAFGLIAIQQQRQRAYHKLVEFVEGSFNSAIPKRVSNMARPVYSTPIYANCSSSSVEQPSGNYPAYISSEHQLTYRPVTRGACMANVTVLMSWHVLKSKPEISIVTDYGEFDDIVSESLKKDLMSQFGIEPTITAAPLNGRWTPLQRAAINRDANVLNLLIQDGADVDGTTPGNPTTPLQLSIRYGSPDIAKILLAAGADPNEICDDWTALDLLFGNRRIGRLRTLPNKEFVRLERLLVEHGGTETLKWPEGEKEAFRNSPYAN